jgi:hypothetical protein
VSPAVFARPVVIAGNTVEVQVREVDIDAARAYLTGDCADNAITFAAYAETTIRYLPDQVDWFGAVNPELAYHYARRAFAVAHVAGQLHASAQGVRAA